MRVGRQGWASQDQRRAGKPNAVQSGGGRGEGRAQRRRCLCAKDVGIGKAANAAHGPLPVPRSLPPRCAALGACRALAQAGLTTPAAVLEAGQERVKGVLAGAGYDRYGEALPCLHACRRAGPRLCQRRRPVYGWRRGTALPASRSKGWDMPQHQRQGA